MLQLLYKLALPIAQVAFEDNDDPAPPPPPTRPRLSFGDLQKGLQSSNEGNPHDRQLAYLLITMVALVILLAIILQMRERKKTAGPPNSSFKLGRELSHKIRFPFGTRFFLSWVARSAELPVATLLISSATFDRSLTAWSREHTFSVLRRWGHKRLKQLRPLIFDAKPGQTANAKTGAPQMFPSAAHP